jgi:hypothetical protein
MAVAICVQCVGQSDAGKLVVGGIDLAGEPDDHTRRVHRMGIVSTDTAASRLLITVLRQQRRGCGINPRT